MSVRVWRSIYCYYLLANDVLNMKIMILTELPDFAKKKEEKASNNMKCDVKKSGLNQIPFWISDFRWSSVKYRYSVSYRSAHVVRQMRSDLTSQVTEAPGAIK